MSPSGKGETKQGTSELDRIRLDRKRGRRASAKQKYNESRLVDQARFNDETGNENHNDETDNENHNDEIINGLNCAGSAKELSEHIFKNLSDPASLKNNFTEQLTDDEDEDSAPFSLESTNDANKQPLTPPIYHLPSPQDVFVPLPQTQRNQSQRGNEENVFLLKDLFSTMRSFTGNDNYSVKAFFCDVEENFIFIPHISDLQKIICVKRLLQGPAKTFIQTLHNILTYSSLKAALIEEFEDLFCSYDVHKEMQKRKLRPTESLF
ncbi:hypothetical protein TNCV_1033131 [Trichonephila clavipes]|nr:hypothetical protein TNCV_1033131 [Trichonephila clavipes]